MSRIPARVASALFICLVIALYLFVLGRGQLP
jgi:hypothetical protein